VYIENDPQSGSAHSLLADVYSKMNNYEKVKEHRIKAFELGEYDEINRIHSLKYSPDRSNIMANIVYESKHNMGHH